jgi:hypothetical protein
VDVKKKLVSLQNSSFKIWIRGCGNFFLDLKNTNFSVTKFWQQNDKDQSAFPVAFGHIKFCHFHFSQDDSQL